MPVGRCWSSDRSLPPEQHERFIRRAANPMLLGTGGARLAIGAIGPTDNATSSKVTTPYRSPMADLDSTTNNIMSAPKGASGARHAERLGAGRVHLDFDDDDHVFLVEVTQVPRRHLLQTAPVDVGRVGDVQVQLVDVVLDNRLSVVLKGRPAAGQSPDARGGCRWPADELMQIGLILTDDLGTCYTTWTAESGADTIHGAR